MPRSSSPDPAPISPALLRDWRIGADDRGTVLVVGGARTVPGAPALSGTAALRAGAGTLQVAVAERHATALGVSVPESSVFGLPETPSGAIAADAVDRLAEVLPGAGTVVVGPGLTGAEETEDLLRRLVPAIAPDARVVLDAFALGALSRDPSLAEPLAGRLLLTPNRVEAAYLDGCEEKDVDDLETAVRIAGRYGGAVLLMGVVAAPDGRAWRDGSGHVGLATSGSGDVLAGLTGGFLARGAAVEQAACWATHVHAVAGQRLIPDTGSTGLLARELVAEIPRVIAELER
ncbi:yjeF C-terminal region, hydroxyethylthiazole kinase-related [Amycolatopsis tolypomycina]|uniref:ADP-dependent (S)-NAD(P)H-hydrate dehydratase n=1 Tax=Amycolatopsis tolypomycina TaxID=208445 RepID=A0A1H4YEW4_9PSEU|nr:NAD(P)H-hydrate dehydratase [Amycolatopsis tolypomycina]SED15681.1 yjeF C-terminal region, hydroxyethylthiazole kinase-related [Amycolatopsis tolypomycina]